MWAFTVLPKAIVIIIYFLLYLKFSTDSSDAAPVSVYGHFSLTWDATLVLAGRSCIKHFGQSCADAEPLHVADPVPRRIAAAPFRSGAFCVRRISHSTIMTYGQIDEPSLVASYGYTRATTGSPPAADSFAPRPARPSVSLTTGRAPWNFDSPPPPASRYPGQSVRNNRTLYRMHTVWII